MCHLQDLVIGARGSFWGWNLASLGVGAGTGITRSQTDADQAIQDDFKVLIGDFANIGNTLGNGFTLAGFVGLSRLSYNNHFLSDVIFGAALGTAVGRGVARIQKKGENREVSILPYSDGYSAGFMLTLSW